MTLGSGKRPSPSCSSCLVELASFSSDSNDSAYNSYASGRILIIARLKSIPAAKQLLNEKNNPLQHPRSPFALYPSIAFVYGKNTNPPAKRSKTRIPILIHINSASSVFSTLPPSSAVVVATSDSKNRPNPF